MMNEKASEISDVCWLPLIHGRRGRNIIFRFGFGFTQNPQPSSTGLLNQDAVQIKLIKLMRIDTTEWIIDTPCRGGSPICYSKQNQSVPYQQVKDGGDCPRYNRLEILTLIASGILGV